MTDLELLTIATLTADGIPAVAELTDDTRPVVLVALEGGAPIRSDAPDWLTRGDLRIDVWAETKSEALDLCAEIRTSLLAAPRGPLPAVDPAAVITSVTVRHPPTFPTPIGPTRAGQGPGTPWGFR